MFMMLIVSLFMFGLGCNKDDTFSYSTGVELKVFRSSARSANPDRKYAADNAFGLTLPYAKIENIPDGFLWHYCSCIKEATDDYLNKMARDDGYVNFSGVDSERRVNTFQNKDTRKWMVYVECNDENESYKETVSCIFAYEK
jgi:hypothetical protein